MSAIAATRLAPDEYVRNEIIVKFRKTVADALEGQLELKRSAKDLRLSKDLDELSVKHRVKEIKPLFKNFKKQRQRIKALLKKDKSLLTKKEKHILRRLKRAPKGARVPDLSRIYKIKVVLDAGQSLEEIVAAYNNNPDVEYAELNYIVSIDLTPDDPCYPIQWPLNNTGQMYPESGKYNHPPGTPDCDIDAPEAWNINTGSSQVVIAVLDTGVDYNHRDLQGNMWVNNGEIPGNGLDDDGNGYVDDVYGYDFINEDGDPIDDHGHGTHCAGIIAAAGDNGLDIAGVCWNARIMGLKFLGSNGRGSSSDAATAFYYAANNEVDVISNSWGGSFYFQPLKEAIDYAHSQGVTMAASAGNNSSAVAPYPAKYDHVISVAATDSHDQKASFSNYGDWVDIAAPGVDVLSLRADGTSLGTTYDAYTTIASGTSMSCPHVAGVIGLLLSHYPDISLEETEVRLLETADDISEQNPYYVGRGRVNAHKAIRFGFEGAIKLDKDSCSCDDILSIQVLDLDLIGQTAQQVTVTTDGGDEETVTLVPDANKNKPWIFAGTISTSMGSATVEDGLVQVSHGQIITAAYEDDDDATGNPATAEATAMVDCEQPLIFNVQMHNITSSGAVVTFETDELTTGRVRCGLACGEPYPFVNEDLNLATTHTVYLSVPTSETTYYLVVDANDAVGNESTDDNGGQCYSFTTTAPPVGGLRVPGEYGTIQAAIDAAVDGETIWVADGTYTGLGNRDIDFKGKAITLRNENGPHNCIIDCETLGRGFDFHSGEGPDSVLDGFTVTNGYSGGYSYGGGIRCTDSSPTIRSCIITQNTASYGGGAISCAGSSENPTIDNCIISDNSAPSGGGIYCGDATIINCIITTNTSDNSGGGICCEQDSTAAIKNCIIKDNIGRIRGGGISAVQCAATITDCIITGNSVPVGFLWGGGGIYANFASAVITNCTFSRNSTPGRGGGAWFDIYADVTVTNCIFWDNYPNELYDGRLGTGQLEVGYSDVAGGWTGEGNIDTDPLFVDPANGDYHLTSGSPCIDTGTNDPEAGLPVTDLEGTPRPLDGDGNGSIVADIGAYEYWVYSPGTPVIQVSEGEFEFFTLFGEGNPDDQILSIRNWGEGTLVWEITEDCPWLEVSPVSGDSTGEFDDVILSVDVAGMPWGRYSYVLMISAAGAANSPRAIKVDLYIQGPVLQLSANEFYFSRGHSNPADQTLSIWNSGGGTLDWQIAADCPWLEVTPTSGQSIGEVDDIVLSVDGNDLLPGDYNCVLTVSAEGAEKSPQTVDVNLHVQGPILEISQDWFLSFCYGPNPPDQVLYIWNSGGRTLDWQIAEDCPWLEVAPTSGQCFDETDAVVLTVNTDGMLPGDYNCVLTVSAGDADNSPRTVNVNLYVRVPLLELSVDEFVFFSDGSNPPAQTLSVRNAGYRTLSWQITEDCPWLEVTPTSGSSLGEIDDVVLSVDCSGLLPAAYSCILTVSAAGTVNSPKTVPVYLLVSGARLLVPTIHYPTIQAAIDAAEDGDVVVVADGTYTGEGNRDIDFNGKAIVVRSENGPENCIIDCQGTTEDPHRGFYFHSAENAVSVVEGFTISGGAASFGGGMYNEGSSPTVTNCVFVENIADFGGGIENDHSSPRVISCLFAGNVAEYVGGGMDNYYSSPTVINCIFKGNTAWCGGGIDSEYGSPKLTSCTCTGNSATYGGALYSYYDNPTITNCILWGDTPEEIYVDSGAPVVTYCAVEGGFSGVGNIDADPCFADTSSLDPNEWDQHLQSQAGRWDPGPNGWVYDANTSPCIDAGDPNSRRTAELWPHGKRINIGAYGGTKQASMSLSSAGNVADLNADDVVNFTDFAHFADTCQVEAVLLAEDLDRNGIVDFKDLDVFADNWLWEE